VASINTCFYRPGNLDESALRLFIPSSKSLAAAALPRWRAG
jgi:hypothetical protein